MVVKIGLSLLLILKATQAFQPCVPKDFGYTSFVCACNSTYCDDQDIFNSTIIGEGQAVLFTSDWTSKRFDQSDVAFTVPNSSFTGSRFDYILDSSSTYQSILGFGGAFTDAAALNIAKMEQQAQNLIIQSYYGPTGLDYNIGRVNMGGCDFSTRPYTYADQEGDVDLDTFELAEEDTQYKIPLIKLAQTFRPDPIKLFASPWSAPAWMKSNNELIGKGYLLPQYYETWANYFVRFLNDYGAQGIQFWGLTAQNEPEDGNVPGFSFNCMGWNSTTQREWIVNHLGPQLEQNNYGDLKLMILDDQRPLVPKWAKEVFEDERALKYVSGIAVHWYTDDVLPFPSALDQAHELFPDKFLLYTEACNGDKPWDTEKVMLGSWERGENYLFNIIEDLNHWVVGWTDWNLALDKQGGPNWANNFVDAPIIIDPDNGEFYKQPMFYALGHVSRFLPAGSLRLGLETGLNPVDGVAFKRPDGITAIILLNRSKHDTYPLRIKTSRGDLDVDIGPKSFTSVLF